jgi:hypothetical protein
MYRQVKVHRKDTDFQRIVWREDPKKPIEDYRLLTVTYETAAASYLATRCLQQLAYEEKETFPAAATVVLQDSFVDDLISGVHSQEEALELQKQLLGLLENGGFQLRKWSSSNPAVLEAVPPSMRKTRFALSIDSGDSIKTLGVQWHPGTDQFSFVVVPTEKHTAYTRRIILSEIARVFDPLGWLCPVTIRAKILLQKIWKVELGWDEGLPKDITQMWEEYCQGLPLLAVIKINRCIVTPKASGYELIGFCDASQAAYAAVVYLRSVFADGAVDVRIVIGKTRVALLKKISLPRLELGGAVLLARLI